MNWERYLAIKRERHGLKTKFIPENQQEAKKALALGIIDIGDYVEFSLTMEPLLDSAHDPDPEVRKKAIRQIAERKTPFSVQTLLRMLEDEDEEVRLYAASELDRIEGEMQRRIYLLRETLRMEGPSAKNRFRLASAYTEYVQLLLRSPELRTFFLKKALALLEENLSDHPNSVDDWYQLGLAQLLMENYTQAASSLRRVLKLEPKNTKAFLLLSEVYFRLGEFKMIKKILGHAPIDKRQTHEFELQLYWAETIADRN